MKSRQCRDRSDARAASTNLRLRRMISGSRPRMTDRDAHPDDAARRRAGRHRRRPPVVGAWASLASRRAGDQRPREIGPVAIGARGFTCAAVRSRRSPSALRRRHRHALGFGLAEGAPRHSNPTLDSGRCHCHRCRLLRRWGFFGFIRRRGGAGSDRCAENCCITRRAWGTESTGQRVRPAPLHPWPTLIGFSQGTSNSRVYLWPCDLCVPVCSVS